jgi:hypothetical protein
MSAGDFSSYSIAKGTYYDQTAGGAPVLKGPLPCLFNAQVVPTAQLVSARVTGPTNTASSFLSQKFSGPWNSWVRFASQSALDSSFPPGNYTFDIFSFAHGHQFVTNTLAAGSFPNAPTVSNLTVAQSVDAASDFTLTWNPFSSGTTVDFISCQLQGVRSNFFVTAAFGAAGALDGTATSVAVPAGTLLPGHAYLGRLTFAFTQSVVSNAQYGAVGTTLYFSQTDFWLKTQGSGDNTPPAIAFTSPTNGASGVPINSPICAHFTKPLKTTGAVFETGFDSGSGSNTGSSGPDYIVLSPDGLQLALTPITVGWTLLQGHRIIFNPFDSPLGFGDLNGNPLAAETFVIDFVDGGYNYLTPRRGSLSNPQWQTNSVFQVDLLGETNYAYSLEYSSNIITWMPLSTNVSTNIAFNGITHFVDTNAPPGAFRAYRGVAH